MERNRERNRLKRKNTCEELRPDLWSRLPNDLVDVIIYKVLIDLPFSKLYSFCCFCKRWKDVLIASTNYLLYFDRGEFKVFNSRRNFWETVSLQFCHDEFEGLRLENLRLVSSSGGLLCLSSRVDGDYIICNPLTKCFKRFKARYRHSRGHELPVPHHVTELGTRVVALSVWNKAGPLREIINVDHEVFTFHSDIKGDVELMVEREPDRQLMRIYERDRMGWPVVDYFHGVPDGFCFLINGPVKPSSPLKLPLGFCREPTQFGTFEMLIYDLKQRRSRWIVTPQNPGHTIKRSGRKLFGTIGVANQFEVQEIRDTGHAVAFPPPLRNALEDLMSLISNGLREEVLRRKGYIKMLYIEQDDVEYVYVVALISVLATVGPFEVIAVWRHCRVDKSELISEWKEDWGAHSPELALTTCFHVFKPSFDCASCHHQ